MGCIVGSKVGSIHLKTIEKSKKKKSNKKNIKRLTNYLIHGNINQQNKILYNMEKTSNLLFCIIIEKQRLDYSRRCLQ